MPPETHQPSQVYQVSSTVRAADTAANPRKDNKPVCQCRLPRHTDPPGPPASSLPSAGDFCPGAWVRIESRQIGAAGSRGGLGVRARIRRLSLSVFLSLPAEKVAMTWECICIEMHGTRRNMQRHLHPTYMHQNRTLWWSSQSGFRYHHVVIVVVVVVVVIAGASFSALAPRVKG